MTRVHAIEFQDLSSCPAVLRNGTTAFLEFLERVSGNWRIMLPPIEETLDMTGQNVLIDLCSGAGGPASHIGMELQRKGRDVKVVLTDLYPHLEAFDGAIAEAKGVVSCRRTPVDATAVPDDLRGFRTIFNAFHHFRQRQAKAILKDAVDKRQPIGVFEAVDREPISLLLLLLLPMVVPLTLPFWRSFRWPFAALTYLIPVLPFFVAWEGIASWLRVYSASELRELVSDIQAPEWHWTIRHVRRPGQLVRGISLTGRPTA